MKYSFPKNAFTFVELVIVVTIVTIISTIGFVMQSGNMTDSRDTKRISDIKLLESALQDYFQQTGDYPLPGNAFNITNSGNIVAIQGELNKKVPLFTLSSIPTDPITGNYYSFATTANKKQYQLAATLENDGEPRTLLAGNYKSVAKNILPTIILAISNTSLLDIEIGSGSIAGDANRKLFLFNDSTDNIPYGFDGNYEAQSSGKELPELLSASESLDYWQKHDYSSCQEIQDAGKSIGPGEYQIRDIDGNLVNTWCTMDTSCPVGFYYTWGGCLPNPQSCTITHGTGTQTWNSSIGTWNPCTVVTCDVNYLPVGNICMAICVAGGETPCIIQ